MQYPAIDRNGLKMNRRTKPKHKSAHTATQRPKHVVDAKRHHREKRQQRQIVERIGEFHRRRNTIVSNVSPD